MRTPLIYITDVGAYYLLQLARFKALYADSARHERLLETQLEQYLLHSTVTAEFIEESMNDMMFVSNQITANQPIQVSDSTYVYLDELGLGEDQSDADGSKASQRNAIAAAAAVDRSGLMLQKWAMTVRKTTFYICLCFCFYRLILIVYSKYFIFFKSFVND